MVITVSVGESAFDMSPKLPPTVPGATGDYVRGMAVDYLQAIVSDTERMAKAGTIAPTTLVPSCPEWDVAALCAHQGWVHRMATLATSSVERPDFSGIPSAPPGHEVEYLRAGVTPLIETLKNRPSDQPAWNFSGQHQVVGFWARRQALETMVHRWDAERAIGQPSEFPTALAADGIDEWLVSFAPRRLRGKDLSLIAGSIHLHCTDTEGEWTITIVDGKARVEQGHAKGDVAARGRAESLMLLMWNRIGSQDPALEIFGDRSVLDRWLELLQ